MTKKTSRAAGSRNPPSSDAAAAAAAEAQKKFFAQLVKRERAAVSAFGDFLEKLANVVHLDHDGEAARVKAVAAAKDLDEMLGATQQMMGLADV